jgi:hypothetical protein
MQMQMQTHVQNNIYIKTGFLLCLFLFFAGLITFTYINPLNIEGMGGGQIPNSGGYDNIQSSINTLTVNAEKMSETLKNLDQRISNLDITSKELDKKIDEAQKSATNALTTAVGAQTTATNAYNKVNNLTKAMAP